MVTFLSAIPETTIFTITTFHHQVHNDGEFFLGYAQGRERSSAEPVFSLSFSLNFVDSSST